MYYRNAFIFILINILVFCESGLVNNLEKCKQGDHLCAKKLLQNVILTLSQSGDPELKLPRIDPIELKDVRVNVFELIDFTLKEGTVEGIHDCKIEKFEIIVKDGHAVAELTCDLVVKGRYNLSLSTPVLKDLLNGEELRGDGNGEVTLDQIHVIIDLFYSVENRDGETYIKCYPDQTKYEFDVKKNVRIDADNLYIGNKESSKLVVQLLNENWKFLVGSLGKPFMDKAMVYINDFIRIFVDSVPTKYYIADDLTSYVKQ